MTQQLRNKPQQRSLIVNYERATRNRPGIIIMLQRTHTHSRQQQQKQQLENNKIL